MIENRYWWELSGKWNISDFIAFHLNKFKDEISLSKMFNFQGIHFTFHLVPLITHTFNFNHI